MLNIGASIILFSLAFVVTSVDCVWDPANWKENCFQYCSRVYARGPQRAYYNQTSQMCQPLVVCPMDNTIYYDYPTNKCYQSKQNMTQIFSYAPFSIYSFHQLTMRQKNFVCVHGVQATLQFLDDQFCRCESMWVDSGKYNIVGLPYACDEVISEDRLKGYFFQELVFDNQGNIIKYGNYTPQQLQITLKNMRLTAERQRKQYVATHQDAILYAIYTTLQQEPIISGGQYLVLILCLIILYIIIVASFIHKEASTMKITENIFRARVKSIAQEREAAQLQYISRQ